MEGRRPRKKRSNQAGKITVPVPPNGIPFQGIGDMERNRISHEDMGSKRLEGAYSHANDDCSFCEKVTGDPSGTGKAAHQSCVTPFRIRVACPEEANPGLIGE